MKRLFLCADDYGQNSAISQAIIALHQQARLSATSCLTTFFDWKSHAATLAPLKDALFIGLHFNLTEGTLLTTNVHSIGDLLIRTHLRAVAQSTVQKELHAQLDQFEAGLQQLPDFIDGHQHVHQFPVVRNALVAVYQERLSHSKIFIRNTAAPFYWNDIKNAILQISGARALRTLLLKKNIPHNATFAGTYSFHQSENFSTIFCERLKDVGDQGLVMCHPGLNADDTHDPIASARLKEYQYFSSEQFIVDCRDAGVDIIRK